MPSIVHLVAVALLASIVATSLAAVTSNHFTAANKRDAAILGSEKSPKTANPEGTEIQQRGAPENDTLLPLSPLGPAFPFKPFNQSDDGKTSKPTKSRHPSKPAPAGTRFESVKTANPDGAEIQQRGAPENDTLLPLSPLGPAFPFKPFNQSDDGKTSKPTKPRHPAKPVAVGTRLESVNPVRSLVAAKPSGSAKPSRTPDPLNSRHTLNHPFSSKTNRFTIQNDRTHEFLFVEVGGGADSADVFTASLSDLEGSRGTCMFFGLRAIDTAYQITCLGANLTLTSPSLESSPTIIGTQVKAERRLYPDDLGLWYMTVSEVEPTYISNKKTRDFMYAHVNTWNGRRNSVVTSQNKEGSLPGSSQWLIKRVPSTKVEYRVIPTS